LKVKDAIRYIIDSISDIYSPGEAESIAFIVLDFIGFPRKMIFHKAEKEIESIKVDFIKKITLDLKTSRPVQYILGETEFLGLKFRLDENVLIPRQETEELVLRIIRDNRNPRPSILDLGTGSGCIAVTLAKNIPSATVYASDISTAALHVANDNAILNMTVINTIVDDILNSQMKEKLKFDIIVSNPPYVLDSEKQFMHHNVLNFEPATALFVPDKDPLKFYKAIAWIAVEKLIHGGLLYVEINEKFGNEVVRLFLENGLGNPEIIQDIHEKNRFVKAVKTKL
jgi:release factor glutamine methyltransferase